MIPERERATNCIKVILTTLVGFFTDISMKVLWLSCCAAPVQRPHIHLVSTHFSIRQAHSFHFRATALLDRVRNLNTMCAMSHEASYLTSLVYSSGAAPDSDCIHLVVISSPQKMKNTDSIIFLTVCPFWGLMAAGAYPGCLWAKTGDVLDRSLVCLRATFTHP